MIHNLKPYSAYKDSGVPWLGKVPEHWGCYRFALLLRLSPLQANSTVSYCPCTWTEALFVFLRSKRSVQT